MVGHFAVPTGRSKRHLTRLSSFEAKKIPPSFFKKA